MGGSNSANTSKDFSQFHYGEMKNQQDKRNSSIIYDRKKKDHFDFNDNPMQNTYYSIKNLKNE